MPVDFPQNTPVGIDPEKVSPIRKVTPPLYGFNPFLSRAEQEYQELKKTDAFLQSLTTPEAIDEYKNYILSSQFKEAGVESPFIETSEGKAKFDVGADFSEIGVDDKPEQRAFKELRNYFIASKGKIESPDPLRRIMNSSMTAGWVKMLSGENFADIYDKFKINEDGVFFEDKKLNLSGGQSKTINDFMARISGADIDRTFLDKVIETAASLTVDMPLLYLTGGISAGVMNANSVTRGLMTATDLLPRFYGQALQQTINFNLLGIPQTVGSFEDRGVGGALESIFHSTSMGVLAAGTGTMGVGLGKEAGSFLFKQNPAIREELSGLVGSFGFGYLSGKAFGESDADAIATGLGFAATHFTNPRAYKRIIQEQLAKPLRIVTEKGEYINDKYVPDYFIEKNGQLQQIDRQAFKDDGRIVELDVEPLVITPKIKEGMIYYNEIADIQKLSYGEALRQDRERQNGKKLFNDITKDLPTSFIIKNEARLRSMAEVLSTVLVGNKIYKTFSNWKLPDDIQLRKDITRVVNKNDIPYNLFKEWLINDIKDYIIDPVAYKESLETYSRFLPAKLAEKIAYDPSIMGDMLGVMDKLRNTIMPNENLSDYNNRLLPEFTSDKIRLPNGIMYAKPKPAIAEEVKSEQLKAGDTVKFESAGKEQTGKIKTFTNEYKNVDVELKDGRTVNLPVSKLLGVGKKPAKEKTVEKSVEKVEEEKIEFAEEEITSKNEVTIKAKEDVSKSEKSNVIESTSKIEKVEPEVKPTKQIEPTKPIEAVSQEEVNQAKRDFKTATVGKTLDAKGLQTPAMKEPLDKLIVEAQKQADKTNKDLLEEHQGDGKWVNSDGTLRKNKAFNAGHKLAYMLIKEEPALTNKQVDAILRNALPELYGDRSPETSIVENMLNTGKLKDIKTYRKAVTAPEETVDVSEVKATPELRMRQSPETAKINEEQRLGNALVGFIDTVKKEGDKTKTVEQLIKEQQEFGNLTPEEADYIRQQYGRNVNEAYNKLYNIDVDKKSSPKTAIKLQESFKEKFKDYDLEFAVGNVKQEFTPEEIKAAGLESSTEPKVVRGITTFTFSPLRGFTDVKVTLDRNKANDPAAWEELAHGLTLIITDPNIMEAHLKRHGWNGKTFNYETGEMDYTFRRANEEIMRSFKAWNEGTGPGLRGFTKMKAFFKMAYKWFTDAGFREEARFFKKLMNAEIPLRRKISPQVQKDYDAKVNKMSIEDVQTLYNISEGVAEGIGREFENFNALRQYDKNHSNNRLDDKKFLEKFAKSSLNDVPSKIWDKVKRFWLMNQPPDFTAKWKSHHKEIYDIGNEYINKSREAANNNMATNWDVRKDGKSLFFYTPDEVKADMFNKIDKYRNDMYEGKLERRLTFEEVYKKYNWTPEQIEIFENWRRVKDEGIRQEINSQRMRYLGETENLAAELSKKKFKEFFPEIAEDVKEPLNEAREILKTDEMRKEAIADFLTENMYDYKVKDADKKVIGDAFYFPFTRKSSPDTWIIEMVNAEGKRRSMDADNEKEANAKVNEWRAKGYDFPKPSEEQLAKGEIPLSFYRIGDVINEGQYWNRLSERQLKNLAALGHIPYNEPVIKKLREAMKAGKFEQHTLETDFTPGIELDAKRFEQTIREFADISAGGYRLLGNLKMNKAIEKWAKEIEMLKASRKTPAPEYLRNKYDIKGEMVTDSDIRNLQTELDYSTGYVNNITHSDKSVVDSFRKLASIWMLGVKPSFIAQQPFQLPHKVLPMAIAESNKSGNKLFWEALKEAPKLALFIRANQKGLSEAELNKFGFDKEMYDIYLSLKHTGRAGKAGIEELTDKIGDIEYRYERGIGKGYETMSRLASLPAGAIEKFTRIQALNTFYKIGKEKKLTDRGLIKYVSEKVDLTMDLWGPSGRAPLFASKVLGQQQGAMLKALDKSFMTFKTYATHNLAQYEYLMRNRQWKALGVKAAVGFGLHGATKFPLMAGMFALIDLFSDDDTEYEVLSEIDKLNMYIPGLGTTLSRGLFANVGLNVTNLLDERTVFPTDLVANLKSYSAEGMVAETLIGAPYGLAQDYIAGAEAIYDTFTKKLMGEPMAEKESRHIQKQLRRILPLTLRNIMETMAWNKDGVTVRNNVIIKKDDLSWRDVFYKALSFQPLDVNKKTEEYIYGFPAKFKRAEGKVAEIKKVYKEIASSKKYTPEERTEEMKNIAKMWRDAQAEVLTMKRTQEYRDAIKTGLVK